MIRRGTKGSPHAIECDFEYKLEREGGIAGHNLRFRDEGGRCSERFVSGSDYSVIRSQALRAGWTETKLPGGIQNLCPLHSERPRRLYHTPEGKRHG